MEWDYSALNPLESSYKVPPVDCVAETVGRAAQDSLRTIRVLEVWWSMIQGFPATVWQAPLTLERADNHGEHKEHKETE
jgi:hypothetical protein